MYRADSRWTCGRRQPSDPEVAFKIPGGSTLVLQIHYTTTGKEEQSLISVGFRYPQKGVDKISHHFVLDPHNIAIAPGDPMWRMSAAKTIPDKRDALGHVHAHARPRPRHDVHRGIPRRQARHAAPDSQFQFRVAVGL